ncbi:uncharacterized protein LOC115693695 [Syzygium oleosum]|uniref:uncharacterized protein LOC115693695 n=1 Tax=Syzygium oleosum TaxID=219896 RepID=UPI0011D1A93C|nr:uncharacterized protein LOC115693695 [Syzygium oleosum]
MELMSEQNKGSVNIFLEPDEEESVEPMRKIKVKKTASKSDRPAKRRQPVASDSDEMEISDEKSDEQSQADDRSLSLEEIRLRDEDESLMQSLSDLINKIVMENQQEQMVTAQKETEDIQFFEEGPSRRQGELEHENVIEAERPDEYEQDNAQNVEENNFELADIQEEQIQSAQEADLSEAISADFPLEGDEYENVPSKAHQKGKEKQVESANI